MQVLKLTLVALAATFAGSTLAEAIDVKQKSDAPGNPEALWAAVGDFCAVKNWHPAVADCEEFEEDGKTYRTLTLGDGGKIKEVLTDKGDTSYSYDIIESPLPVKNYSAKLQVMEQGDGVGIEWTATFDASGVEDAEAEKIISGIFNDGVTSIKTKAVEMDGGSKN